MEQLKTLACPDCGKPGLPVSPPEPNTDGLSNDDSFDAWWAWAEAEGEVKTAWRRHAAEWGREQGMLGRNFWTELGPFEDDLLLDIHQQLTKRIKIARRGFANGKKARDLSFSWLCPQKDTISPFDKLVPAIGGPFEGTKHQGVVCDGKLWAYTQSKVTVEHGSREGLPCRCTATGPAFLSEERKQRIIDSFAPLQTVEGFVAWQLGQLAIGQAVAPPRPPAQKGKKQKGPSCSDDACLICNRGLSDAISLRRGIGPECWDNVVQRARRRGFSIELQADGNYKAIRL